MAKTILVFLAAFLVIIKCQQSTASAFQSIPGYDKYILKNLLDGLTSGDLMADPVDDSVTVPFPLTIDFAFIPTPEDVRLAGTLHFREGSTITGLSLLDPYSKVTPTNFTYIDVLVGLYTETITIVGNYDLDLNVTSGENLSIVSGSGPFDVELVGAKFVAELLIRVNSTWPNHFRIHDLALHLGFDCIAINMDGATADGAEIDWVAFSANFKSGFDNFWNSAKGRLAFLAELFANMLLSECTIADTIPLNLLPCINETINPAEIFGETSMLSDFSKFIKVDDAERATRPGTRVAASPKLLPRATCDWLYENEESTTEGNGSPNTMTLAPFFLLAILAVGFL